ncbi:MAG TPA: type 1 glutamine amidotransferase domain-containing protein [Dehalococcoidia bacterium]
MQGQQQRLDGLRVAILVTDDFEQVELVEPRRALQEAGATAQIVAPRAGEVQGMNHDEKADRFPVDLTLEQANPDDFDAVLLPGGALNADQLRVHPRAQAFVRRVDETDRPIAVICHAPWLLASAGLVNGRTVTSYHTLADDLRNAGARWLNVEVARDRNWVSSRGPRDIPAFNQAMVELFAAYAARRQEQARYAGAPRGDGSS